MSIKASIRNVIHRTFHDTDTRVLVKGASWSMVALLLARGLGMLSSIAVARTIGQEDFGKLAMVLSTTGVLSVLGGSALGLTVTKYFAELRRTDPQRVAAIYRKTFNVALIGSTCLAFGTILFNSEFGSYLLGATGVPDLLLLGAPLVVFGALRGVQGGALSGMEDFKDLALVSLVEGVLNVSLVYLGARVWHVHGALIGYSVSGMLVVAFGHVLLRRLFRRFGIPLTGINKDVPLGVLRNFSLPAFISSALIVLTTWGCNVMLVVHGSQFSELAILNVTYQWRTAILFFPNAFGPTVLPLLTRLRSSGEVVRYKSALRTSILLSGGTSVAIAAGISILSPFIMSAYGRGFATGTSTLVLVSVSAILSTIAGILGQSITSAGEMWAGLWTNLVWAISLLLLSFTLSWRGAVGIAGSLVAAYLLHLAVVWLYSNRLLNRTIAVTPSLVEEL
jgi:O-antigen/teichoic acid export membrane protein